MSTTPLVADVVATHPSVADPLRTPYFACAISCCKLIASLTTPYTLVPRFRCEKQPQEFFNVSVNIRMTAVKLEGGGLWVRERERAQALEA